jgi:Mg-chelatase subunit ChlD
MLVSRFNRLRARLDALKAGRVVALGLLERARLMFVADDGVPPLDALTALDVELDRAGVHTTADARLLREVGQSKGRLAELATGLAARAGEAVAAFELAMDAAERLLTRGTPPAGLATRLEQDYTRLARVVKIAAVFGASDVPVPLEIFSRPSAGLGTPPQSAKLALAEFVALRALRQVDDSVRRRRDLDLAYELVLRMSADAAVDRTRLRRLRLELGAARERVRASPAVRSLDELVRHVRHAARRDPPTAFRSVRALYDRAIEGGDAELASLAADALQALVPAAQVGGQLEKERARRALGWSERAHPQSGEALPPGGKAGSGDRLDEVLRQLAFELDEDQQRALELASGAGRYFDVEDVLSEEIVEAQTGTTRSVQRRVAYPTQAMTYEFTGSLENVHNFVVTYPGTLTLDLAAGRQMVRSYLEEVPAPRPRRVKQTAVRVYVLDASGSMHGARARFRDAILIAELNAIRVKASAGLPFDPLYFSYFNDAPSELERVDSGAKAARQLDQRLGASPAEGQTDISLALLSAFESIGTARGRDPYLARATVVLITDGEDSVDLELIRRTRKPYEGLDIALSFISLGEENADLKSLVLEQRREGGRAFYHHLSDGEIQLARTEFDSAWRTLWPADAPVGSDTLDKLLPHLETIALPRKYAPCCGAMSSMSRVRTRFAQARIAALPDM